MTELGANRRLWATALLLAAGCLAPDSEEPRNPPEEHCWRCERAWSEEELLLHDRHTEELGLSMYASGCSFCRHHGAYKDQ